MCSLETISARFSDQPQEFYDTFVSPSFMTLLKVVSSLYIILRLLTGGRTHAQTVLMIKTRKP